MVEVEEDTHKSYNYNLIFQEFHDENNSSVVDDPLRPAARPPVGLRARDILQFHMNASEFTIITSAMASL